MYQSMWMNSLSWQEANYNGTTSTTKLPTRSEDEQNLAVSFHFHILLFMNYQHGKYVSIATAQAPVIVIHALRGQACLINEQLIQQIRWLIHIAKSTGLHTILGFLIYSVVAGDHTRIPGVCTKCARVHYIYPQGNFLMKKVLYSLCWGKRSQTRSATWSSLYNIKDTAAKHYNTNTIPVVNWRPTTNSVAGKTSSLLRAYKLEGILQNHSMAVKKWSMFILVWA